MNTFLHYHHRSSRPSFRPGLALLLIYSSGYIPRQFFNRSITIYVLYSAFAYIPRPGYLTGSRCSSGARPPGSTSLCWCRASHHLPDLAV